MITTVGSPRAAPDPRIRARIRKPRGGWEIERTSSTWTRLGSLAPDAPRAVARRFNMLAWLAFGVLVATGIWNILAVDPSWDSPYGTALIVKLAFVVASGLTAFLHARSRSRRGLAVFGTLSGATALGALFL